MIEIGRYNQTITKDNRHCPFCGCNVIEDEVHFLFQCPTYSMIRNKFYCKVKTLIPNIIQLPINSLINKLMNSSNYFINIQFIKCFSACFDVRDKLISKYWRNRPLALRGHVTNASFQQWVGILLMPKIDRAHKNYLIPEIWEETHLREKLYGTLIFQQSSMICIGRHVGGHTLALQQFKCNGRKTEVIHNFKNHILVTWPATNLLISRKWCRFAKPNHYYFVKDMTH